MSSQFKDHYWLKIIRGETIHVANFSKLLISRAELRKTFIRLVTILPILLLALLQD